MEHYKNKVDDRSIKVGGSQHITILDNYKIPLSIRNYIPHMPLGPHTDDESEILPNFILASDKDWDPTLLDCEMNLENEIWFDDQSFFSVSPNNKNFDEVWNYRHRSKLHQIYFFDAESCEEPNLDEVIETCISCNNVNAKTNEPDYELMKWLFNCLPVDIIKNKFQLSTQYYHSLAST